MFLPRDIISGVYTKPRIFLCETNKERICQLDTIDTKATLKLNAYSELSFEVARVYNDIMSGKTYIHPFYNKIEALRLIFVEGLGYFEIQGPECVGNGIEERKAIKAYSLEYTLSQKYLENFYVNMGTTDSIEVLNASSGKIVPVTLYNRARPELSLLHLILEKIYGWSIGHVDAQLCTLSRQFEVDRESVYDFIMNEICVKFNCYAIFDTINNTINLYAESPTKKFIGDGSTRIFTIGDPDAGIAPFSSIETVSVDGYKTTKWEYGVSNGIGALVLDDVPEKDAMVEVVGVDSTWETDVYVSYDNLLQETTVNYDADSIKTVLTVTYGDNEDISEVNLGLPYLTDISYYYSVDWMGRDLYDAYTAYLEKSNNAKRDYTNRSKEILKLNDQIAYEENRLSLEYSLVSVDATTVGTYYTRHENADGSFYYSEVSLPSEYKVDVDYYSNMTTNVNEEKVNDLHSALKNYFYGYRNGQAEDMQQAYDTLEDLSDSFKFMKTYTMSYLINGLKNAKEESDMEIVVLNFLGEIWPELGRSPLKEQYLAQYKTAQEIHLKAGDSDEKSENYGHYYTVALFINSIEDAISQRDKKIKQYETERKELQRANAEISTSLLMSNNFTQDQLIRLNAFLREDELHLDDIVTTSLDDLSASFKIKQDAMENGRIELKKICEPQLQFAMSMANIYALPEFAPIVWQFQLGNIIKIKLREREITTTTIIGNGSSIEFIVPTSFDSVKDISFSDDANIRYEYNAKTGIIKFDQAPNNGVTIDITFVKYYIKQSRLLQVDINFEDFSDFSCEFGELTSLRSQSDIHADLLSKAISAGKSVATNSSYWTKGSDTATATDLKIQQGLLDATTQIKAMDGRQGVVIDAYGIHLRDVDPTTGSVDPKQGWITNNKFLYSDDGFKSTKSVFGEYKYDGETYYGILAEALVGNLLIGSQIKLENSDGTMTFDNNGLSVTNEINSFNVNPNDKKLLKISNQTQDLLYVDDGGNLNITGTINAVGGNIGGCEIIDGTLKIKNANIAEKLTADNINADGINAKDVNITGTITATSGEIGGCVIDSEKGLQVPSANITGKLTADQIDVSGLTANSILVTNTSNQPLFSASASTRKVEIAGWTVDNNSIRTGDLGDTGSMWLCRTGTSTSPNTYGNGGIAGTSATKTGWSIAIADKFGVDNTGSMFATNANITGNITATSGNIGGCEIIDNKLTIDTANITTGVFDEARIPKLSVDKINVSDVITIGKNDIAKITEDTLSITKVTAQNLHVKAANIDETLTADQINADGIKAVDVDITGVITSDDGLIGGWSITEDGISKNKTLINSNDGKTYDSLVTLQSTSPIRISVGDKYIEEITGYMADDVGNNTFDIYCTGYLVSFEVTRVFAEMDDGSAMRDVENYEIVDIDYINKTFTLNIEYRYYDPSYETIYVNCKYAYLSTDNTKPSAFLVLEDGSLYANAAKISGNITANSGKIGGWNITDTSLENDGRFFSSVPSSSTYTIGGSQVNKLVLKAGDNFGVKDDGTLYANNAILNNANVNGSVTSDSVNITGGSLDLPFNNGSFNIGSEFTYPEVRSNAYTNSETGGIRLGIAPSGLFASQIGQGSLQFLSWKYATNDSEWQIDAGGTWNIPYLASSSSVTSDATKKNTIKQQGDVYSRIFYNLTPVTFKYNNGTSDRTHMGLIAQDVENAVLAEGITTKEFAPVCYDLDENNNKINYGIRYEELVSMCIYEIQKLKYHIDELNAKLERN